MDHSSGIPVWTISVIPEGSEGEITLEETVRRIADVKLAHAPGEVYEYATINYDVLALIIEEVTGKKYEDYITGTVLNNAGLFLEFQILTDSVFFRDVKPAFLVRGNIMLQLIMEILPPVAIVSITSVSLSFYHILYTLFIFIISEGDGIVRVSAIKRQP